MSDSHGANALPPAQNAGADTTPGDDGSSVAEGVGAPGAPVSEHTDAPVAGIGYSGPGNVCEEPPTGVGAPGTAEAMVSSVPGSATAQDRGLHEDAYRQRIKHLESELAELHMLRAGQHQVPSAPSAGITPGSDNVTMTMQSGPLTATSGYGAGSETLPAHQEPPAGVGAPGTAVITTPGAPHNTASQHSSHSEEYKQRIRVLESELAQLHAQRTGQHQISSACIMPGTVSANLATVLQPGPATTSSALPAGSPSAPSQKDFDDLMSAHRELITVARAQHESYSELMKAHADLMKVHAITLANVSSRT